MANNGGADQTRQRSSKKTSEIVVNEVKSIGVMGRDAVFSGSWIWPVRGFIHTVHHPSLLGPIKPALIKATLFTLGITAFFFVVGYLPTVAVLAFVSGPLAFVAAIPLIVGAGAAVGLAVSRAFWFGDALEDLFDEVLLQEDATQALSYGRNIDNTDSSSKSLGSLIATPFRARFSKEAIIRYIISLPLNLIPVVGPAIFFLYNGSRSGPSWHNRYFELRTLEAKQQASGGRSFDKAKWIEKYRGAYTGFGTMAIVVGLVPGAVVFVMFGNTVGAALWASRIEKEGKVVEDKKPIKQQIKDL